MLILGPELSDFLRARRTKNKQSCQPGQIYCVGCRAPRFPAGDLADYIPSSDNVRDDTTPVTVAVAHHRAPRAMKLGTLQGICPDCYCIMNRRVSMNKLPQVLGKLAVTFTKAREQVSNSSGPSVNSDLG